MSDILSVAPKHVAILGLGPSLHQFVDIAKGLGGARALCDEVWGINALGGVLMCDRLFHMDDVRVQQRRADADPASNIASMLNWLRTYPGQVITSRAHPDYPCLQEFPLERFINEVGYAYFNSTAAYAVGFAILLGVEKISMFGCDFTYANAHHAEKGRACVEYWLGFARARGIAIEIAGSSSLMDGCEPADQRLYGYDTVHVDIDVSDPEAAKVTFRERLEFATAAQIEARYDHSQHPNPLVSGKAA